MKRLGARLTRSAAALVALPVGLLIAALAWIEPQPVRSLRDIVFDSYQRHMPRAFIPDMPARIVDIDDASLQKLGQWPWPRTVMARLVEAIGSADPAVIALDIVFSEPDRTSPERIITMLPPSPERDALERRLATGNHSNDRTLAETMARHPVISGIVLTNSERIPPIIAGFAAAGDPPEQFLPRYNGAVTPVEILEPALKGFGALNWIPEYDQIIRRVPAILSGAGKLVPSLGIEALRVAQGASTIIVKASNASGEFAFGQQTGIVSVKVGEVVVATDFDGAVRIRYAGSKPERRIPAWKIIAGEVDKQEIEGRLIFVGSSASALSDLRATPMDAVVPGVEVHAEFVEHVLAGSRLSRPDWARGAEIVAVIAFTLLAALVAFWLNPLPGAGFASLLLAGIASGSWYLFRSADLLLDPVLPGSAAGLAFAITSVARWRASDLERRAVRSAFSRYLAPAMVEQLAAEPDKLRLGGERREMTILFSDVRGFTGLSEGFRSNPQGLTALMNRLLTPLSGAIIERQGTIDKYMGDAIMAFWNAPLDVTDHATQACAAALEMRVRLKALNLSLSDEAEANGRSHQPIDAGIGINTGDCVVGNMGSDIRFDYSVLGDPVNLASRLEGQTKDYGVNIILGAQTAALVADRFALIEIDSIRVKGKQEPQRIFALLGDSSVLADQDFRDLKQIAGEFLAGYRAQDWNSATEHLVRLRPWAERFGIMEYLSMMTKRIENFRTLPPPPNWDGIYIAGSK